MTVPASAEPVGKEPTLAQFRVRQHRVGLMLVVALLVTVAISVGWVVHTHRPAGPVEVVEAFFAAIMDREVDEALSYVANYGSAVRYGEQAVFLHPDAVDTSWRLVSARQVQRPDRRSQTWVEVTIADQQKQATGRLQLTKFGGDRWRLLDPLIRVDLSADPYAHLQVNDRTVMLTELYDSDLLSAGRWPYQLLPGRYQIFPQLPGSSTQPPSPRLLLPDELYADPLRMRVPQLEFTADTQAAVQQEVNALLDECAASRVREVPGCPFAAGGSVATERETVYRLRDIRWRVHEYPTVQVRDPGTGEERALGLPVTILNPGTVRLTATGEQDGELVEVAVDCQVGGDLRVGFGPDGNPQVYQPLVAGTGLVAVFDAIMEPTCPLEAGEQP